MENEKRLTYKQSIDGYTDVGLREGVTIGEAICKLADIEEAGSVDVVLCKDCEHSAYWDTCCERKCRTRFGTYQTVSDNDFCSRGIRRRA